MLKAKLNDLDSDLKIFKKSELYNPKPEERRSYEDRKPEDRKPITTKNQKGKKMQQNFFTSTDEAPRRIKTEGNLNQ